MNKQEKIYMDLQKEYAQFPVDKWDTYKSPYRVKRYQKMFELLQTVPHKTILEIGCGQGNFTEELRKLGSDITAIDVTPASVAAAKIRNPHTNISLCSFDDFVIDKKYDVVICSEVLYYMLNREEVVEKLARAGTYLLSSNLICDLPNVCLGGILYEWKLQRYPAIKKLFHFSIPEHKLCVIALRKLSHS